MMYAATPPLVINNDKTGNKRKFLPCGFPAEKILKYKRITDKMIISDHLRICKQKNFWRFPHNRPYRSSVCDRTAASSHRNAEKYFSTSPSFSLYNISSSFIFSLSAFGLPLYKILCSMLAQRSISIVRNCTSTGKISIASAQ